MSDLVQCSNCSRLPQPKEEFLGRRNQVCKMCRKCREKQRRQMTKPGSIKRVEDWREVNKERVNFLGRKAADAWVKREKEKDAVAYNAKIQASRKKCTMTKVNQMKTSAIKRGLTWELSAERALELVTSPCVYCGFLDLNIRANSIDRLDSFKNYTVDNCVACCTHCNMMKGCYDPDTFIERCRRIGQCSTTFPHIQKCDLPKTQTRKKEAKDS